MGMYFKDTMPWKKECNFDWATYQRFCIQLLACPFESGSICLVD